MTYELAKELKDAGFAQVTSKDTPPLPALATPIGYLVGDVYVPTLAELIEACGKELKGLHQLFEQENKWIAQGWVQAFFGSIPEEAVAHLWLALNKKV